MNKILLKEKREFEKEFKDKKDIYFYLDCKGTECLSFGGKKGFKEDFEKWAIENHRDIYDEDEWRTDIETLIEDYKKDYNIVLNYKQIFELYEKEIFEDFYKEDKSYNELTIEDYIYDFNNEGEYQWWFWDKLIEEIATEKQEELMDYYTLDDVDITTILSHYVLEENLDILNDLEYIFVTEEWEDGCDDNVIYFSGTNDIAQAKKDFKEYIVEKDKEYNVDDFEVKLAFKKGNNE